MSEKTEKQPVFLVRDLETLKVMSDPLHLQVLELLNPAPQSVNQISHKLGISASRLYYHFNRMESTGLIRVVETRTVNNIIEKIYWVTADEIEIDRDLLNFSSRDGQKNVSRVILSAVDATRQDMLRSIQARSVALEEGAAPHPRQVMIKKIKKRITDEFYQRFVDDFNRLLVDFEQLPDVDGDEVDASVYSVACFLYPSFAFGEDNDQLTDEGNYA